MSKTLQEHTENLVRIREYLSTERDSHVRSDNQSEVEELDEMLEDLDSAMDELL